MVNNITILKVLEPFLSRPFQNLHLADISRITSEPHPTARQWLNKLEKKGVLLKEIKGRLTLYSLNLDNPQVLNYLVIAEKELLIRKCDESLILKELTSFLIESLDFGTMCLIFGSASQNIETAGDIDLLLVGKTDENKIKKIGSRLNKEMHIIKVSSLEKISKALKDEIIKKHLIINGSESLLRWMLC